MDIRIREMNVADIEQVLVVEHASFTIPWTKDAFLNELLVNALSTYIVAECAGEIAGYFGFWQVVDEAHITNIAVLPKYRGHKIGDQLLREGIRLAREQGIVSATLEVRTSNTVAQSLYAKYGFEAAGVRKGYYTDNNEDAIIMWVKL